MHRKNYEENTRSSICKLRRWEYIFLVRSLKLKLKSRVISPKTHQECSGMRARRSLVHACICVCVCVCVCVRPQQSGRWVPAHGVVGDHGYPGVYKAAGSAC